MYQYFILQSKKTIRSEMDMLISLFEEVVNIETIDFDNNQIIVVFENLLESSLQELSQTITQEFLIEIRIFESNRFQTYHELERNIKRVKKMLQIVPFDISTTYLNSADLLYFEISKPLDTDFKKLILQKYYGDFETKNILKVFFECNQNTSEASKRLYMHRNTLIQRLDKFYEETGFNPRRFKDAMLIYRAIEN